LLWSVSMSHERDSNEEITEITDDMILELVPRASMGKLLHLPPPLPAAARLAPARPLPPARRRKRGTFRVVASST
jgi:hypothetical protein